MHSAHSIELLPATTRTKLRSTQILTSLPQIVSELLQNSLDAGAGQVDIGVDCVEWICWVKDDGEGITREGMSTIGKGSEEGRYGSSKAYDPPSLNQVSTFGFRGEALASAADISCLEISSRTAQSRESWSIIVKAGKNLYNGPSIRWCQEKHGTVVCIRDAFYNLPIRRLSHPNPSKTFELIRREIELFSLVFPEVSFSLQNTNASVEGASNKTAVIRIPRTKSCLATFRHIFGRALAERVEEVLVSQGRIKIEGFISLDGTHSKTYQFLYINRHLVTPCDLHRIIDRQFASSSFAKYAYGEAGETTVPRQNIRRSPRKSERHPVYVLNLSISPQDLDNCFEPAKASVQLQNHDMVSSLVSSLIQSFLVRHGFVSEGHVPAPVTPSQSPRKKRKMDAEDASVLHNRFEAKTPDLWRPPSHLLYSNQHEERQDIVWKDPSTGQTFVVDSRTGHSYPHDDYTIRNGELDRVLSARRTVTDPKRIKNVKDSSFMEDIAQDRVTLPDWLDRALQANNTYALIETPVPTLSLSSSFAAEMQDAHDRPSCHGHKHRTSQYFQQGRTSGDMDAQIPIRRFKKEDILAAKILNQIDRKFIACLIPDSEMDFDERNGTLSPPSSSGRALVLVDQHAADERIRVERFLKDLCLGFLGMDEAKEGVKTKALTPAVPVLLTDREALKLAGSEEYQAAFRGWGVQFCDLSAVRSASWYGDDETVMKGYTQVFVKCIPLVVSDKLLMGDELRELIKGYLVKLEEDGSIFSFNSVRRYVGQESFFWMKALRWCPRELLDLVNSKACRGAIMFNDSLTMDQCRRLVEQLAETAFPFQCAHGRPSLVPLANIGSIPAEQKVARQRGPIVEWDRLETMIVNRVTL